MKKVTNETLLNTYKYVMEIERKVELLEAKQELISEEIGYLKDDLLEISEKILDEGALLDRPIFSAKVFLDSLEDKSIFVKKI